MAMLAPRQRAHTFDGLDTEAVEYARKYAQTITAKRGDTLSRQGETANRFFVVQSGYAKLVSTSQDGNDIIVGIVGPRDALGHAAVAGERRGYMVTSCALTPMTVAVWSRDNALAIAREFPEVHARIDVQLMRNLEALLGRLHLVSEGKVHQRLARALVELAERHGEPHALGIEIAPPLTRQDIAAMVGTTLFTASRVLADWEDRGLVESSRAKVRVRSLEGLRALAEHDE
jgi:CRP-like cAMP-binding protein